MNDFDLVIFHPVIWQQLICGIVAQVMNSTAGFGQESPSIARVTWEQF